MTGIRTMSGDEREALLAGASGWERIALVILPLVVHVVEEVLRDRVQRKGAGKDVSAELLTPIETSSETMQPTVNPANAGSGVARSSRERRSSTAEVAR